MTVNIAYHFQTLFISNVVVPASFIPSKFSSFPIHGGFFVTIFYKTSSSLLQFSDYSVYILPVSQSYIRTSPMLQWRALSLVATDKVFLLPICIGVSFTEVKSGWCVISLLDLDVSTLLASFTSSLLAHPATEFSIYTNSHALSHFSLTLVSIAWSSPTISVPSLSCFLCIWMPLPHFISKVSPCLSLSLTTVALVCTKLCSKAQLVASNTRTFPSPMPHQSRGGQFVDSDPWPVGCTKISMIKIWIQLKLN